MTQKPEHSLISVITIFYNTEKYIEEAVSSILNQSYTNWELLLIDDGSTDNSTVIARNYAKKYSNKIRYLEHPNHQNKGMSASRNLGIDNALGDLICFLDADDVWLPGKLQDQVQVMLQYPDVSMVYGRTIFWWSWSQQHHKKDLVRRMGTKANSVINPPTLVPRFLIVAAAVPGTCSIMCRKEMFSRIRFEDSFRGLYEDQAFYYKVFLTEKVFASDKIWDKYRQHSESACYVAENNGELNRRRSLFLLWFWDYLQRNKNDDYRIYLAISQEFWKTKLFAKRNTTRFSETLKWMIKWLLITEKFVIPETVSYYFWKKSRTFQYLSVTAEKFFNNKAESVIWDLK